MTVGPFDHQERQAEPPSKTVARWKEQRQLDFDIEFFDRVLCGSPDLVDVLRIHGQLLTQGGYHQRAREVDCRLSELCPHDPIVRYNLACSLALLGKSSEAIETLRRAIELGYRDFDYLHEDTDLDSLRRLAEFRKLLVQFGIE